MAQSGTTGSIPPADPRRSVGRAYDMQFHGNERTSRWELPGVEVLTSKAASVAYSRSFRPSFHSVVSARGVEASLKPKCVRSKSMRRTDVN